MRKCSLANLPALFSAIAAQMTLYLPTANKNGGASFVQWTENTEYAEFVLEN